MSNTASLKIYIERSDGSRIPVIFSGVRSDPFHSHTFVKAGSLELHDRESRENLISAGLFYHTGNLCACVVTPGEKLIFEVG